MLKDSFNRHIRYLRLSITDVCNFKCNYCLPDGYQCTDKHQDLSAEEIKYLVAGFASLGLKKVRITGGEPSIRKDLVQIISDCKNTPGIEQVAITTNGYKLDKKVASWAEAGIDQINISIDSLSPDHFRLITGHDRLAEVLKGIEIARSLDIPVKINTVLLKQFNYGEFETFLDWIKHNDLTLRFIELMQTGDNKQFFEQNHIKGEDIRSQLLSQGWQRMIRDKAAGPAQEFQHPDYQGRLGLIMPYSKDFCDSCNRLRVSSQGKMHLCLFAEEGNDLRHYLQPETHHELPQVITSMLQGKKSAHALADGFSGATTHLAMLGG
jgi:GTP 3',8-cyclase